MRAAGRRNNQVVGPALSAVMLDDRQERAMDLRHCHDRDQPEDLLGKGLTGGPPTRGREFDARPQLSDQDSSDGHVIARPQHLTPRRASLSIATRKAGVEDRSAGYAGASSVTAPRAAAMSAAKSSATSWESSAMTSAPLPTKAGPMGAMRLPPR